jgi:hypothetical protein
MQDNDTRTHPSDPRAEKIRSMNQDLEFIAGLLGASIYKGKSPNLFERLQEFRTEAGALQDSLSKMEASTPGELSGFEKRLIQWKHGVYEFIESNI